MSVPTFLCPSGETCFAPECCAHQQCMHAEESQVALVPMPLPPDKQRFSLAADAFFGLFPKENGCDTTDPRMVVLFELMDKAAAVAHAQWLEAAPAAKTATPTDTEILDFMEARMHRYAENYGEPGQRFAWSRCNMGIPLFNPEDDTFYYATLRDSVIDAMRGAPEETPFSECVSPECPIGCPESHATPPSYWAMVDADTEPDEPVVQEVNPKRSECCGAYGEKSGPEEYFEPCKDCPHTREVNCG